MAQGSERIQSLDIVRGVAVMGILAMNIVAFAWPFPVYFNPIAGAGSTGIDLGSWQLSFLFFDGKMRGLFSILFGASTLLVIQQAVAAGRSGARAHYARMVVLLLFGLAHFYLIWFGDILVSYALAGMVLYSMRGLSPTKLVALGCALIIVSTIVMSLIGVPALIATDPGLPAETRAALAQMVREVEHMAGSGSSLIDGETAIFRSDYATIVHNRFVDRRWDPLVGALLFGFETLGLMLFGMALFKSGFFTGEWDRRRYARWAMMCAGVALPPLVALVWWQMASGFDAAVVFMASMVLSAPFDIMMAVAWAAIIVLWAKGEPIAGARARVAAAGRMAFTNYLATSAVMTTLFYGYGLNLFGTIGRAALWLPVVAMWALMLLWSKPWLDRYRYGPMEWIWRSLSRGSLQPMRRGD